MWALARPGLVGRANQGVWQYRNIPINMEYCEGYLRLSSIKRNQFNGFLFGPCGTKWCILYSLKGFAFIILLYIIREKTRKENAFQSGPEILVT